MFGLLLLAFVAERAHQWQSLTSRDWSVRFQGKEVSRRLVVWTALAIGWGEGLAFYITSERTFWVFIFWVTMAHIAITVILGTRRVRPLLRLAACLAVLIGLGFILISQVFLRGDHRLGWLGQSFLWGTQRGDADPYAREAILLTVVLAVHAIPCFVVNLLRTARGARARAALVGVGLSLLEWIVVAKCIWFEAGSLFPDLTDWWNLGPNADFVLHPLWMAPFLAHVAIDAIRLFEPGRKAAE